MKKILVTPAGRKRFLSILSKYLIKYRTEFDEWHLWCNTDVPEDVDYIYKLEKDNEFIKVIPFPDDKTIAETCFYDGIIRDHSGIVFACTIPYFIQKDTTDENAVYLRLDDDVVFIAKSSIRNLFEYRLKDKESFLVYGNIVNNSLISHIHQLHGVLPETHGKVAHDALDPIGLYSGDFSVFSHNNFFEKLRGNLLDDYKFATYKLTSYDTISIQVISWFGKDYKKFGGVIPQGHHEEPYQSVVRPQIEGRTNAVFGDGLFCHYAAGVNRDYIDKTDILSRYAQLADEYLA